MGSLKVTFCAGAAVVAAVLVPTAYASGEDGRGRGGSVSVTPSTPSPGAEVTLKVSGCGGRTATAVSAAFVADARLVVADGAGGALVGDTRVRSSIAAGLYDVQITCVDFTVKGRLKVVQPPSAAPSRRPSEVEPATPDRPSAAVPAVPAVPDVPDAPDAPDVPASPVAPVRAGGGGTAPLASVEDVRVDGRGPGTVQAVVGLVLAGAAAAAVVFRGARRRHRAD